MLSRVIVLLCVLFHKDIGLSYRLRAIRLNELNKQSVIIDNVLINASHFSVNGKLKVELSPLFTNCPYTL